MRLWQSAALAAAAGTVHTFSFAPHNLWWLQFISFAALFALTLNAPRLRDAACISFAFGLAHFLSGVSWLYISLHVYGLMVAPLAAFGVFALACYMALYPMLAAMITWWLAGPHPPPSPANAGEGAVNPLSRARERVRVRANWWSAAIFSAAWLLTDHARGWVFTGFPWLAAGYAHTDSPLAGYAPYVGVYAVGAIAALAAALVWIALRAAYAISMRLSEQNALKTRMDIAYSSLGLVALVLAGGWLSTPLQQALPSTASMSIRLLQGNVPQSMKFDNATIVNAANDYIAMVNEKRADLIVLPETAIPVPPERFVQAYDALAQAAKQHGTVVLTGAPIKTDGQWTNSVIGYAPDGTRIPYFYSKQHLVPFGEFIPPGFRWFVDAMQMPLGDFARGAKDQPPFNVPTAGGKSVKVAVNICYEDVFGEELTDDARSSDVLLNVSNLAWFGDSWAMPQHLQIARMRSIELGRPSIRATNTGVTAAIDANGKVLHQLPLNIKSSLNFDLPITRRDTVFTQYGNVPGVTTALLILLLAAVLHFKTRRDR
ncbi:MAG: apolipoprotein N-acyltransferase [Burkholderiaceae bacterium]